MRSKVVTVKELTKDNPTFCLSPNRVFNRCHVCPKLDHAIRVKKDLVLAMESLKCEPKINEEWIRLIQQKRLRLAQLERINEQIKKLYQNDTGNGEVMEYAKKIGYPRWKITKYAVSQGWIAKQKKEPD